MSIPIEGVPLRWPEDVALPDEQRPSRRVGSDDEAEGLSPSRFQRVLEGLAESIEEGERIISGAAGGYTNLDAAELIALQAGIYRYSEAIDLAAKLVDRATSAVRTVLQGH